MKLRLLILFSLLLLIMPTVACSSQDVAPELEPEYEFPDWQPIIKIDVSKPSATRGDWGGEPIEFILPVDYKLEVALYVEAGDVVFTVIDYWGYHKHDDVVSKKDDGSIFGEWSIFSVTAKQNGEVYRCYFDYLPGITAYEREQRVAYFYSTLIPHGWERVK